MEESNEKDGKSFKSAEAPAAEESSTEQSVVEPSLTEQPSSTSNGSAEPAATLLGMQQLLEKTMKLCTNIINQNTALVEIIKNLEAMCIDLMDRAARRA